MGCKKSIQKVLETTWWTQYNRVHQKGGLVVGKNNLVYVVYAGTADYCYPIYETTKKDKAERYVHDIMHSNNEYTKVYIDKKYARSGVDKRNYED